MRRALFVVAGIVGMSIAASAAWASVTGPTVVVGSASGENSGAATAGATYVAFARNRPGYPNVFDGYVRPAGQAPVRVNARGQAYPGGFDLSGSHNALIFQ